jgi:hypothetical protein
MAMTIQQAELEMKQQAAGVPTPHSIQLTATLSGNKVSVSGPGGTSLPRKSGQHRFSFTLDDQTGLNVKFLSLYAADDCTTCPPPPGENSQQIHAVNINGTSAAFTDDNRGPPTSVSYQWNFTCDDQSKLPITYDPIINNGGSNIAK